MSDRKTKPFACSYHHDGSEWSITIDAYDWEDAQARVKKLGFIRLDGELKAVIPANMGPFVKLACWLRNIFNP